ncbi:MAG: hypothetical protein EAX95_13415 [Candidatus Thorarchaeota archaeon]|nr:hypothetical protein [Candidatus Thorarchaeota archaeon]
MSSLGLLLNYTDSMIDSHIHVVDTESLDLLVSVQQEFGVQRGVLICHSLGARNYAEETYPGRFIYAKYFSGAMRFVEGPDTIAEGIRVLRDEGYHLVKMQSAPVMRGRAKANPEELRLDSDEMEPMFEAIQEIDVPFILHLSDPDTYYATRYNNKGPYSTKEHDLEELEGVISRYPKVRFQIAHFASQPEIHRLENLGRWFDTYPNFNIDTSSARWMARELGKNPDKARAFFTRYQDRIQFGTDCVAFTDDRGYYTGRYSSLRMLLETDVRGIPLPFADADTAAIGGTFINGLELGDDVLRKVYWTNAAKFHGIQ